MKTNNIYTLLIFCAMLIISSCDKDAVQIIHTPPNGPLVRVYNFALNGPSANFFINDFKISAANSTTGKELATGLGYSGVFPTNNSYINAPTSGSVAFKTIVPLNATVNPGITVANVTSTIETGKYYSFYTSGVFDATAKTTSGFIIEDMIPAVDTSTAYVRIVNTVPNAGIAGFDLKGVNTTTLATVVIAAPTAYKAASEFVKVPNGIYNLTAVSTNTPTSYTIIRNAVSFSKGFVYTISTRGDATLATGTNARALDLTRNR
ncbi:DUF4397 domain-containing protein [Pedobacter cryophilus]|uniref:DUF4397 domain-containing protein n=1 Tax=Pedobacter cryophilus TaxID=2571271 RepID=A0A4U1C4C6_9SPHI|nr:DUF4397 domain-containing protein [Pedobacter cryophilus]TKC00736.1 DUF4397 domain-containing protein [Pedobacter cryophilus]